MDMDIKAICYPDYDRPALQSITVIGESGDGRLICTLEAVRWAESCFEIWQADNLLAAFDEHNAFAYGLAEDVRKRKRAMAMRYGEADAFAQGFIGITTIRTEPNAAGNRCGLELINFLKKMHAGMRWYAGLQAAPYDLEHGSAAYRNMRQRLIAYYASDSGVGFKEDVPKLSPGLMTAFWDQE